MKIATFTTWNENVGGTETGNHKGCPYDGLAGGYFQRNDGERGRGWIPVCAGMTDGGLGA